ncbi:transcription elongation [Stylonychia lemnae]|uniref:Transcription elongation n=1 Tax=Stylonychia lemnae TaxID=5949 RepID=A0A078B8V2_STYLE|nr:transcription elongation [Stylonychia lemnae]|eukprot:CDW89722.1 transcription elongation [Stylonychia lemnae]
MGSVTEPTIYGSAEEMLRNLNMIPYETIIEYMADIALKKRSDPKAVTTLLKKLYNGEVDLKVLEHAKTEKLVRELLSLPLDMFMSSNKLQFELMKKTARELLKKWADQRRESRMQLDVERMRMKQFSFLGRSSTDKEEILNSTNCLSKLDVKGVINITLTDNENTQTSLCTDDNEKSSFCSMNNLDSQEEFKTPQTSERASSDGCVQLSLDDNKPREIRSNISSLIDGTGLTYRDAVRRKLVNTFKDSIAKLVKGKVTEDDKRWATECALRIEDAIQENFKSGKSYGDKARSLLFNLNDPKNFELRYKILNQDLTATQLVVTDIKKLASEYMKQLREESLHRTLSMKRTDWEKQQTLDKGEFSGLFTCECGSEKTGFVQYQIERADEPMTNFVYCYDCQNRWKC